MRSLYTIGRIFYGISITVLGIQAIYDADFPYMLIPAKHSWIPGLTIVSCIFGALLILAGACIVFQKWGKPISLLLGTILLLVFCFYFIPYQFMLSARYIHYGAWENAAKELALAGGAFVIAGCFQESNDNSLSGSLSKLIHFGPFIYALTILSFGIDHFLYAKEAAGYVPSWIPNPISWIYFAGAALLGASIAIILKIKVGLFATLLGSMILIWFIILHIPKVIAAPIAERGGELTSAFIALAYSGIAFVIAGNSKKQPHL